MRKGFGESTAAASAAAHLEEAVRRAAAQGRGRLPGLRALADGAGVSLATMAKVAAAAVREGRVVAVPGQGSWVAGSVRQDRHQSTPSEPHSMEALRVALQQDIAAGRFAGAGPLPDIKTLCGTYGYSHPMVSRVLAECTRAGLLVRRGRRHFPTRGEKPAGSTVVLLARGMHGGELKVPSARTMENLTLLERMCSVRGIALRVLTVRDEHPENEEIARVLSEARRLVDSLPVLGFVLWTMNTPDHTVTAIARAIHDMPSRLAVLCDGSGQGLVDKLARLPQARVVRTQDDHGAGEAVARFLISHRHRRLAFFSVFHAAAYSLLRLQALHDCCALVADMRVASFTADSATSQWDYFTEVRDCAEVEDLHARTMALAHPGLLDAHECTGLYWNQVTHTVAAHRIRRRLWELLEQAYADAGITAWVAVNDFHAQIAQEFLRQRWEHEPRAISLVGFDDTMAAFESRLTSYSFNPLASAQAQLEAVIAPPARLSRRLRVVEVEGYVHVRTSGRARTMPT